MGLHITAIRKFLNDHPKVKEDNLTTSQINSEYIKPETAGTGQAYIHQYQGIRDDINGAPLVSSATVFVSHAWRYAFYDVVVDVMEQHVREDPDAYFWLDLFTNNQNEVANKDFDWFSQTFRDCIRDIGQVLLVLSPWYEPIPICRAWCLFEIHNSIEEPDVSLSIRLPLSEVDDLREGVIEDQRCIINALSESKQKKLRRRRNLTEI